MIEGVKLRVKVLITGGGSHVARFSLRGFTKALRTAWNMCEDMENDEDRRYFQAESDGRDSRSADARYFD